MNKSMHDTYSLPPEWHPQSGIQLTWPHAQTDWADYLNQITLTFIDMTRAIARHEKVLIVTPFVDDVRAMVQASVDKALHHNILFRYAPTNDIWARDHAFITLLPEGEGVPRLVDFRFNGWGEKFEAGKDNLINSRLFFDGAFRGHYVNRNAFVLEGGSIESDGKGTVFTTSQCLLAPHRNQPFSREEIELRLKQMLGARRIVWLDHGNLMGDDTDGHIDTIMRTAPDDTLLCIATDNVNDPQHDDFKALEAQLRTITTLDGRPYRLLRLPIPDAIYDGEDRLPATYANFVILNGAVLCPTYAQPHNDRQALDTLAEAFQGREIIPIDARTVIRQHGSLHCLTMQYPEDVIL